jgi:hypothetical protein
LNGKHFAALILILSKPVLLRQIFDERNLYAPKKMCQRGFSYYASVRGERSV